MKPHVIFATSSVLIAACACCIFAADESRLDDTRLLAAVSKLNESAKITAKPHFLPDRIAMLCKMPSQEMRNQSAVNPHLQTWINIYAAGLSGASFADAEKKLPTGALVIKEKFHADKSGPGQTAHLKEGSKPDLFTVMIKREAGFFPEGGDWEYAVVNGDASRVLARGKIESCMECHRIKKDSDFLYRNYLKKDAK